MHLFLRRRNNSNNSNSTSNSTSNSNRNASAVIAVVVLVLALALVPRRSQAQSVRVVQVGRHGDSFALRFTPEDTAATVGGLVQFQFYPLVCCYPSEGLFGV